MPAPGPEARHVKDDALVGGGVKRGAKAEVESLRAGDVLGVNGLLLHLGRTLLALVQPSQTEGRLPQGLQLPLQTKHRRHRLSVHTQETVSRQEPCRFGRAPGRHLANIEVWQLDPQDRQALPGLSRHVGTDAFRDDGLHAGQARWLAPQRFDMQDVRLHRVQAAFEGDDVLDGLSVDAENSVVTAQASPFGRAPGGHPHQWDARLG